MASSNHPEGFPRLRRPTLNPLALMTLVAAMALIGGGLVLRFASVEENHALMLWQNKLNLIADSRAAAMNGWLDHHFKELSDVADNPSLQLYLTDLYSNPGKTEPGEAPAQATFLQNLLSITADRLGFVDKPSAELKSINADVRQPSGIGIAIVNRDLKIVVSTAGLPAIDDTLAKKLADAPKNQASLIDIFTTEAGSRRIGFVVPIYPIQGANAAEPAGFLAAVKNVDDSFLKLLQHPGATEKTLEAVLLRREGDNVVYLSHVQEKASPQFAVSTPDLDTAYAVLSPNQFAVKKDGQAHATLMTSRAIARSPWIMMEHIDRDQALAESDAWRRQTEAIMGFALLAVMGGMVAVWYYGTSKRTRLALLETQRLAAQLDAKEKLLRVVTDNQLESVLIVDGNNVARFANKQAANAFHMHPGSVVNKQLDALMGAARAEEYGNANKTSLENQEPLSRTWQATSERGAQVIRSQHIPLAHIPVDRLPDVPGVLIVDQDVTDIVAERERRARTLQKLIDTLVTIVDKRDPFAGHHSAGVALMARETATGMGLDHLLVNTAETAGKLMNIGKIIVPRDLLTRTTMLAESEIKLVRESLQRSADLLQGIEFDGPVVETLRQTQERYDGDGPLRLKGEAILVTARIVAAANAFVGMVSRRSYHPAMGADQAIKILLKEIDTRFDRRVVIALADFVENKQGYETIKRLFSNA